MRGHKYEDGYKFVIEIEDQKEGVFKVKNTDFYLTEYVLDQLTTYKEKQTVDAIKARQEAFDTGMEEIWELVRKIYFDSECGGLTVREVQEIYGCKFLCEIFNKYTVQEVKAKYDAWKTEKEKFHVGDVVNLKSAKDCLVLVTYVDKENDLFSGFKISNDRTNGLCFNNKKTSDYEKTGRTVDFMKVLEDEI